VTIVYRSPEDNSSEALLTYKQHTIYGRVSLDQGKRHYVIESLPEESGMVVWAQINQAVWNDERRPLAPPPRNITSDEDAAAIPADRMEQLLAQVSAIEIIDN
jgi:hypothetical protein